MFSMFKGHLKHLENYQENFFLMLPFFLNFTKKKKRDKRWTAINHHISIFSQTKVDKNVRILDRIQIGCWPCFGTNKLPGMVSNISIGLGPAKQKTDVYHQCGQYMPVHQRTHNNLYWLDFFFS